MIFKVVPGTFENVNLNVLTKQDAEAMIIDEFSRTSTMNSAELMDSEYSDERDDVFSKLDPVKKIRQGEPQNELEKYLIMEREKGDTDPVQFWTANQTMYPTLSKIALHYVSIPASTGDVERLFSTSGAIIRARRSRLLTGTLEKILMYREYRMPFLLSWENRMQLPVKRKGSPSSNSKLKKTN